MLIKNADDHPEALTPLRQAADGVGSAAVRAQENLRKREAGKRGEDESTYLINFDYGQSPNWAVIHDLRLECRGRTAQMDHVLINRFMELFVLETKHFHAGVKITDEGEFMRWNRYKHTYEGMASPLQQNERHIAVLTDVLAGMELPTRLGMKVIPQFHSFVLVSSQARIDRSKSFDSSRVIKADQLKPRIWREVGGENPLTVLLKGVTKMVSADTVESIARALVNLHVPAAVPSRAQASPSPASTAPPVPQHVAARPASDASRTAAALPARPISDSQQTQPPADAATAATSECHTTQAIAAPAPPTEAVIGPSCKKCNGRTGEILYGKFGYYFRCSSCEGNTSIRFTCATDHHPRLRKAGSAFFRDCPECQTSAPYWTNAS